MTVLNYVKNKILKLTFTSNMWLFVDEDPKIVEKIPELVSWEFSSFTSYDLKLQLQFSNPLYVSSMETRDSIDIDFLNPMLFVAKKDDLMLEPGYRMLNIKVV